MDCRLNARAGEQQLEANEQLPSAGIKRGFVAMLPFWLGVVPFAIAFGILARTNGFSILERWSDRNARRVACRQVMGLFGRRDVRLLIGALDRLAGTRGIGS